MKPKHITIIGPRSIGKSTVAKLVSKKLNLVYTESDALMDKAMQDYGGLDKSIREDKDDLIMERSSAILQETFAKENVLLDLAGGAISSSNEAGKKNVIIIKESSIVIGLIPFTDDQKSIDFLLKREKGRKHFKDMDETLLKSKVQKDYLTVKPLLEKHADIIILVEEKNPEQITQEIVTQLQQQEIIQ